MTGPRPTQVFVEVTDTLAVGFTTGIQRVVREVIAGLASAPDLEVVPVLTPRRGKPFRTLTAEEAELLRHHPAGGRAGRRADNFGVLAPVVRRVGDLPAVVRTRETLRRLRGTERNAYPVLPELRAVPPPGSVFLDIEGSWYDPTPRSELLPALRASGVRTMALIHDVMPIVHPEWFTPQHIAVFRSWLEAHLRSTELLLANSECTAGDVRSVARTMDIEPRVTSVPLGADHPVGTPRPVDLPETIGRYLLVVGTLEPRKNQRLVLEVFDRLRDDHPDLGLVLVGKEGWMVDDLVGRIRNHPENGHRLLWLGGTDDAELAWLYDHAFLSIAPSRYEGLGVPVMEALDRGCATLVSTGGAQPEAAAGSAELFDPHDADGLARLVERHLDDPSHHSHWVERARAHRSPSWAETAAAVAREIRSLITGAPGVDH